LSELGLIAPLGALVVLAFLYLQRLSEGPATTAWGAAWLALYVAGLIGALPNPPVIVDLSGLVLGSLFPALLLAGSLTLGRSQFVAWPVAAGLAIGLLRAALVATDHVELSLAVTVPLELPLSLGAAGVSFRTARGRSRSFPEQLMGPGVVLLALVNAADPLARLMNLSMVPIVLCWLSASLAVALLQVMTFLERIREREQRLLAERELLHGVARMAASDPRRAQQALEEVVRAVSLLAGFDGFGIWALEANGTHLRCAARLRRIDDAPETVSRLAIDDPLVHRALASDEAVTVVDLRDQGETLRERARTWGVAETAAAPLRASGRALGIVFAALTPDRHFDANDIRLLATLAQEIALVLAHAESLEQRAHQAGALEDERRTLRALIEAVPAGILLADRDGRITMLSRLGADQYGLGDPELWIRRSTRDAFAHFSRRLSPEEAHRLSERFAAGQLASGVFELHFQEPDERILEISLRELRSGDGRAARQLWVSRDATKERRAARALAAIDGDDRNDRDERDKPLCAVDDPDSAAASAIALCTEPE
jgi:PAS domain S-box-containing protein